MARIAKQRPEIKTGKPKPKLKKDKVISNAKKDDQSPEFEIIGDVQLRVLHDKGADRTTVTMYPKVPENFIVFLKEIITIPDMKKNDMESAPVKDYYKQILAEFPNDPDKRKKLRDNYLSRIKRANSDWRKFNYTSTLNFYILYLEGSPAQTQYLHYQLPGANHQVFINIEEYKNEVMRNLEMNIAAKNNEYHVLNK